MDENYITAREMSLVSCPLCHKLNEKKGEKRIRCKRCGTTLHSRVPNSLQKTWALVITACILLVPANIYPIMTVTELGRGTPDTIISGIIALFKNGLWGIGTLVFVASILIPILKLLALILLLLSVNMNWRWNSKQRTKLYNTIEFIGRWSMLDIFMTSIVVALVKLGLVLNVDPNVGASAFALVVIVTMFAALSFDTRIIWDNENNEQR